MPEAFYAIAGHGALTRTEKYVAHLRLAGVYFSAMFATAVQMYFEVSDGRKTSAGLLSIPLVAFMLLTGHSLYHSAIKYRVPAALSVRGVVADGTESIAYEAGFLSFPLAGNSIGSFDEKCRIAALFLLSALVLFSYSQRIKACCRIQSAANSAAMSAKTFAFASLITGVFSLGKGLMAQNNDKSEATTQARMGVIFLAIGSIVRLVTSYFETKKEEGSQTPRVQAIEIDVLCDEDEPPPERSDESL